MPFETDVFVVGGGPAGLVAAIALRRRGLRVTVADAAQPPIDRPCGEGLMPDAVAALREIGIPVAAELGAVFEGIRFVGSGVSVEGRFPGAVGIGVRRTTLHQLLVEHAAAAGVELRWGQRISGLTANGVEVKGQHVASRWIVGADGGQSAVRRWAGLEARQRHDLRFAFRRHYRVTPWSDFMEIHWGAGCQMYVTPVGPQEVCVALISRDPSLRIDPALPHFPEVARRLAGAEVTSTERGAVSASRRLERVCSGRIALLGDASGSVDAITGEGLCLAFRQAGALAEAVSRDDLAAYEAAHRRLRQRPALMASLMLTLEHREWLRRRALLAMSARPGIFSRLLALHLGAVPATDLAAQAVALGWTMLSV